MRLSSLNLQSVACSDPSSLRIQAFTNEKYNGVRSRRVTDSPKQLFASFLFHYVSSPTIVSDGAGASYWPEVRRMLVVLELFNLTGLEGKTDQVNWSVLYRSVLDHWMMMIIRDFIASRCRVHRFSLRSELLTFCIKLKRAWMSRVLTFTNKKAGEAIWCVMRHCCIL